MPEDTDHHVPPPVLERNPITKTRRNPWTFWIALSVAIVAANVAKYYHVPAYLVSVPLVGTDILSPAVDFVVTTTQGLFAILLLSIYFNYFDRPRIEHELSELALRLPPPDLSQKLADDHASLERGLRQLTLDSVRRQAQAMTVREAVADRYPRVLKPETLVNMILPDRIDPFVKADIQIKLEDVPGELSYYRLIATYTYFELDPSETETEYVAGIATNVDLAIQVQMEASIFKDIFHTSNRPQLPAVKARLGLESLRAEWRSADSPPQFSEFERIEDAGAVEKYLGRLKDRASEIQIYVAKIGRHAIDATIRFTVLREKVANTPYLQWQTYMPMYLRHFDFDAQDFTWKGTRPEFHWSPFFFAYLGTVYGKISGGQFRIPVHTWLAGGQGAVVLWSADSAKAPDGAPQKPVGEQS